MAYKAIVANNLIGDSIYCLKSIDLYLDRFGDECKGILVLPTMGGDIVRAHFENRIPIYNTEEQVKEIYPDIEFLRLDAGRALQINIDHYTKFKEQMHISQAYAFMLGVNCDSNITPPLEWIDKLLEGETIDKSQRTAIIGPFSKSCTRHAGLKPNKTLDDWKWEFIIRYLRRHNFKVLCAAAPDDYLTLVSLPLTSYRTGSLKETLKLYKEADLVITVDSGTMHLASLCDTPTLVLLSSEGYAIPPQFICPLWAKNTMYIMVGDVNKAEPAALLYGIKGLLLKMEAKNLI